MSLVTFSVPVTTGANDVTTADVVKSSGTWPTHSLATGASSLGVTLSRIVAEIPSSVAQTSAVSDISGATATSTASTRAIDVKGYVEGEISALVDGAPAALNTLNELSAALNDTSDYAATVATALGNKAALAGSSSQAFATEVLSATAITEHSDGDGFTIGKNATTANGETWIEIDTNNHVLIKGKNAGSNVVTLVTFAA